MRFFHGHVRAGSGCRLAVGCGGPAWSDARGAVYVEFLIAFLPLFVFFSCLVQLGVLEAADLVTKHAAWMATRAAIVIIPDDPAYYGGTGAGYAANVGGGSVFPNATEKCEQSPGPIMLTPNDAKLADVERAANSVLSVIDPAANAKVTYPSTPGGSDDKTSFGIEEMLRVQVRYPFQCKIPIGGPIVCPGGTRTLTAESVMPMQGANYYYTGSF